ncbi:MAG: Uma2 family endonuclease [Desulfococcaceae bacterium]|jgi:Uma2 family endonuclease|nr:Uma2 family endonuclease [Desulfococcaceae bacterium]
MAEPQGKYISHIQYLEAEEYAEYKSEYYHGELFAMTGASFHHNVIATNITAELHSLLRDSDCFVFGSDMKVQIEEALHYTYPDVSIVCGDTAFAENRNDTVTNPLVIIEILSASTGDYDRGGKFRAYRSIASLKEYILADQYSCHIEYFFKNEKGQWVLDEFDSIDDVLTIRSVRVQLPLKSVYHRVEFR